MHFDFVQENLNIYFFAIRSGIEFGRRFKPSLRSFQVTKENIEIVSGAAAL